MNPSIKIVILGTLLGPLVGTALLILSFFLLINPITYFSADKWVVEKKDNCITLPENYSTECANQKNPEFHDMRIWDRTKAKRQLLEPHGNMLGFLEEICLLAAGGYIFGLIPALLTSAYVAICIKKRTSINFPFYLVIAAVSSMLNGAILMRDYALITGAPIGIIGIIVAMALYPLLVKKMVQKAIARAPLTVGNI